jgi:exosortase/archaeosortase family protein
MKKILSLALRYLIILFFGLGNVFLLRVFLEPLTFQLSIFLLRFFGEITVSPGVNHFLFNSSSIYLIDACIAVSAYYLMLVLILATPEIKFLSRVKAVALSFLILLLINIFRIVLMALILNTKAFEILHLLFWYIFSLMMAIGVWFFIVKIFKINKVPIYTDFKFLIKNIQNPKGKPKHN